MGIAWRDKGLIYKQVIAAEKAAKPPFA